MDDARMEGRSNSSTPWLPRILIIDHHDSYTLNVLLLLASALRIKNNELDASSTPSTSNTASRSEEDWISNLLSQNLLVLPHTHPYLSPDMFDRHLRSSIDAIILSPGPGSPERDGDFGAASRLIRHLSRNLDSNPSSPVCIPIFGICLGHQGLVTVFGGGVKRAKFIRHGTCSKIRWTRPRDSEFEDGKIGSDGSVFEGVMEGTKVVRYNSLTVEYDTLPSCLRVTAWAFDSSSNSAPAPKSSIFSPLPANSISDPSSPSSSSFSPNLKARPEDSSSRHQGDGRSMLVSDSLPSPPSTAPASPTSTSAPISVGGSEEGEAVILALEHTSLPFWGVQFHPESVESNGGTRMIQNFLDWVEKWWIERSESNEEANSKVKSWERRESLTSRLRDLGGECISLGTTSRAFSNPMELDSRPWSIVSRRFKKEEMPNKESAPQVFDSLFRFGGSRSSSSKIERGVGSVWLDSARARDPNSRYSYMASPSFSLSYFSNSSRIAVSKDSKDGASLTSQIEIKNQGREDSNRTLWSWMDQVQNSLQDQTNSASCLLDLDSDDVQLGLNPPSIERKVKDLSMWRTGFVGYWGYEMWHESFKTKSRASFTFEVGIGVRPDAEFGFCDKVLALDSERDEWVAFALVQNQSNSLSEHSALLDLQQALKSMDKPSTSSSALGLTSEEANKWFDDVASTLHQIAQSDQESTRSSSSSLSRKRSKSSSSGGSTFELPVLRPDDEQEVYKAKVEAAREYISSGESYELCLTTQFRGKLSPLPTPSAISQSQNSIIDRQAAAELDLDHFSMYKALRSRNPAPYSAFFHLPRLASSSDSSANLRERSILCTSPERFMRISKNGEVEMKPIKGTLARAGWGKGEESMRPIGVEDRTTVAPVGAIDERRKKEWRDKEDEKRRKSLAADVKERAENLMIVDLIRAELLSFCLPSSVRVPALMKVESYATVHQLVTSVCGTLRSGIGPIEAQRRCHSPGSMTGAPKRRSMQILERLEPAGRGKASSSFHPPQDGLNSQELQLGRRGIYSGTLGWIGIDGASDMAVVIRTAIVDGDDVSLGAGGAITYLSDPQKEWNEVLDKASALAHLDLSDSSTKSTSQAST